MMPPRALSATGLRRCSRCRYPLPFRQFHDSTLRAADNNPPPKRSHREATLEKHYQEIENLPRGLVRKHSSGSSDSKSSSSAAQFGRNATPQPMTTLSSGDNDQRTALPSHPARGGYSNSMRGSRGGTRGGPGGGAQGRLGGRAGPEAIGPPSDGGRGRGRGRGRGQGRGRGGARNGASSRRDDNGDDDEPEMSEADVEAQIKKTIENSHIYETEGHPEGNRLIYLHNDHFAMPEEAHNYGQVVELLNAWKAVHTSRANFTQYKTSPASFGDGTTLTSQQVRDMTDTLDAREREIDALIADALRALATTDAKFLPHHTPQETPATVTIEKGQPGGVPTGKPGMAAVLEEALRTLADRETMEWKDPKHLAGDLLAGKFIKFRDYVEKVSVVRLAEEMQWKDGQRYRDEHVGFREPEPDAKKELVQRLVSGWYVDPDDAQRQSAFLKNAARLAHHNGSYRPADKQVLVDTLAKMMPQGQGQGRSAA